MLYVIPCDVTLSLCIFIVSFFGIKAPWSTKLHYVMLHFYKPIPGTNKVDYVFVVVRNQDLCVKVRN